MPKGPDPGSIIKTGRRIKPKGRETRDPHIIDVIATWCGQNVNEKLVDPISTREYQEMRRDKPVADRAYVCPKCRFECEYIVAQDSVGSPR